MTGSTNRLMGKQLQDSDASYGVDWDAERIEIINLEEESNFRFDAYNAGVRWGSDSEIMATRLNMKEERVLMKNMRKINIERMYQAKMHDIRRSLMEQRSQRFRHHTTNVKSNLSANEVARFRRLDHEGRLFPPGSKDRPVTSCGFNSSSIIANAARRLFGSSPSPRASSARPRSAAASARVSEGENRPSMTETTASLQVQGGHSATTALKPRPLTAVYPGESPATDLKSARTRSAPIRAPYSARSGHFSGRDREFESLDFDAIEELLPRGERLPTGSTEEKIAALRALLRRSRMAQERAKRKMLDRKIRELCKVFDSMAMRPDATDIFVPDALNDAPPTAVRSSMGAGGRVAWQGDSR